MMLAIMAATSPALAGESVTSDKVRVAAADGPQTAAILPGSNREARVAPLPKPLSAGDVELYKRVMALQASGQFAAADREMGKIRDELLKGYVLAQRLTAPGAKPKFQEIRAWLADYADLPQAESIHKLAKGLKGGKGGGALRSPAKGGLKGTGIDTEADGATWEEVAYDVDGSSAKARALKTRLRQSLRDEEPAKVEALLASSEAQSLSSLDFDRLRLMVAADHFAGGRDEPAFALAGPAAERSGEQLPAAHWIAGLAQWRMGKPDVARRHFEEVAKYSDGQEWLSAAGAFWAARANLVTKRPEAVNHWLELAATSSRTYYGLLARAELGHESEFSWEVPPFTEGDADLLMRVPAARRALGLLQLGDHNGAEEELRKLYPSASKGLRQSMLVMAYAGQMPALAVSLGGSLPRENGRLHDAAAFPVPDWTPKGGWQVDKALVFALVRQESAFNPHARSGAGAAGLMQLMPATAAAIGGRGANARLSDPEHNLGLGQRYVIKLLEEEPVNGNLLLMTAAYNAGPGNLSRWLSNIRHNDDPLLLVESIPARQTRAFVQRVMTGYWIYQSRLGQKSDTLDAVAAGEWPLYTGQDPVHAKALKVSR
ncbi:Soluble lytic murein transglycosylase precursor [Paramagnetospirillum magnetotacticum MS-1]|uniref:Soluble lytic murein transglycosylase n=1 Tax=Paramagnetospirillum magnetotacticum MS-1 TaxID=272627 RepID=A0A0C2YR77_PARME|nr:Soluble lytic murein transglycosylase precursor [Paramagnetospirillum magnetotacticum MS-1]